MQMANFIDRFRLVQQLAFLAFLFSNILLCGGADGPNADEDEAQPLVAFTSTDGRGSSQDKNYRGGPFGKWMKWTKCAYNVNNQCMDGPGEDQKVVRSYRILAHCANGDDCEEAKLLFCYPSRLDPDAFPDESSNDPFTTPGRRALSHVSVINDPDHNITKACALLMDECRKNSSCKATLPEMARIYGEKWHGFLITRVENGFNIHMPFGKKGKRLTIPDDKWNAAEAPHFYLNFGDKIRPKLTFVTRKSEGNLRTDELTSKESLYKYTKGSKDGIHLEDAPGLWMLGLDILPDEEHQELRLYTMGFPTVLKWTYCKSTEKNDGLAIFTDREVAYIEAWFLKPYTPDKAVPLRPIPPKPDTIKLQNKIYSQQINTNNQGFSRFFVQALVTSGTKMSMKIVIGSNDHFAVTLFHFEFNDKDGTCKVVFQNEEENCDKLQFNANPDSFWFFVDLDKGVVALNCQQELEFNGPLILPIADKAEFQITGEGMELFVLTPDRQPVLEMMAIDYTNKAILKNFSLQMDMLDIVPGQDTFYLLVMAKTFDTSKFIQMKLITKENVSMATMFFKQDCSKDNPDPEQKSLTGGFSPEMEEKLCAPLKCKDDSCAGVFYLFMIFDNAGKIFYNFNGVDMTINVTNDKQTDGPNAEPKSLIPSTAQFFGDLSLPVETDAFKKIKETSLNFDRSGKVRRLTRHQNVIIHGIMFNPEGKFKIEYFCKECFEISDEEDIPTGNYLSEFLMLEFDNHAKTVIATVPNKEGKNEKAESPFPLNLKMAKLFTVKITIERKSKVQIDYEILLNDEKILSAPAHFVDSLHYMYAEKIIVIGNDIALLDKISAIPYILKIETAKNNENAVNAYKINAKFRLLETGQIVQMFLANIPDNSNLAMILGIDNVKVTESGLKVFKDTVHAHIWAEYEDDSGMYKFCFENEFKIIEKGKKTECKLEAQQDYDYKKMGKIVNAEIAVAKDGTIHVDFNGHSMADLKPKEPTNNAAQSTRFVIGGDITLVDVPKQV